MSASRDGNDDTNGFTLRCPGCGRSMAKVQVGTFSVDRCDGCGGMWLDLNELHRVLSLKGESRRIDPSPPNPDRSGGSAPSRCCPRDGGNLVTLNNLPQVHVQYEQCPICGGIYLDKGELNDLNSYTVVEKLRNFFFSRDS